MDKTLLVIILILLVYLAFKPQDNTGLNQLKKENKALSIQIKEMQKNIEAQLDSIQIIEKKETIIRNYYNEIIKGIGSIDSDSVIIGIIRQQLSNLGPARFD